jgi:hypothetical protein
VVIVNIGEAVLAKLATVVAKLAPTTYEEAAARRGWRFKLVQRSARGFVIGGASEN